MKPTKVSQSVELLVRPRLKPAIENQGLSCGIANRPKVPHRMAAQERLRKVPNFARKGELPM